MEQINIKIEGHVYSVDKDLTVLEAARRCGYKIPTLCYYNHGKCSLASCRVCLVEIRTARGGKLFASCVYPVSDVPAEKGFEIFISSPMAVQARKASVELLLSNHSKDCQTCVKTASANSCTSPTSPAPKAANTWAKSPRRPSIWSPRASSGIPASAFCADAALKNARTPKASAFLGFENVVSRPSLARPITAALLKCRAYSAANASKSARLAL
jgi:hypothetical protein